jgi:hypothetical protein
LVDAGKRRLKRRRVSGEEKKGIERFTWRKQARKGISTSDLASSSSMVACESISSTLGMFQGDKKGREGGNRGFDGRIELFRCEGRGQNG